MAQITLTKADIIQQAHDLGAEFIGFAGTDRWAEWGDVSLESHPQEIWPQAKTVIVLGVPLWLPIVEAAPTVLGREQSIVTNELLEKAAYRLTAFLRRNGYRAVVPPSTFSHVWAGYYAGLGTIGWNRTLLTSQYGPRVHLISIFTELELGADPLVEKQLCTQCLYCQKICPAQALIGNENMKYAQVDQVACLNNEKILEKSFSEPCGACIKVCPVGEDRELFQSHNFEKYFEEEKILAQDPNAEEYKDWVHIRSYGSYPLDNSHNKKHT